MFLTKVCNSFIRFDTSSSFCDERPAYIAKSLNLLFVLNSRLLFRFSRRMISVFRSIFIASMLALARFVSTSRILTRLSKLFMDELSVYWSRSRVSTRYSTSFYLKSHSFFPMAMSALTSATLFSMSSNT